MTIYQSQDGKQVLEKCYTDAKNQLKVEVEEQYIETRHGSTHVLLIGASDGQPVLVFHGGNATNPMTLAWFTDLADSYRLIAPDTIGQPGYSAETRFDPSSEGYGEWVMDLLDAFRIESAPMIGTSYGGGIILRAAALAPDRIDRAALVVPAGLGTGSLMSMIRVGLPGLLYRVYPRDRLLEYVLSALVTQTDPNPVIRATIAASLRHLKLVHEFPSADASELRSFTAPVALFVGEDDPLFPADVIIPRARNRLPALTYIETLPNEKHILSQPAQRRVAASIRKFLKE